MAWAIRAAGGGWTELFGPFVIGSGDAAVQYPADWPTRASAAERTAAGVFAIEEPGPRPDGPIQGQAIGGTDRPIRQWSVDPQILQDWLIAAVRTEAERRRQLVLTPGKDTIYSQKQAEILAADTLAGVFPTLLGMTAAQRVLFRFSYASAKRRGETTIGPAIARFKAGASISNGELARLDSIVEMAVTAITAASTVAAKRQAFADINWAWQPA